MADIIELRAFPRSPGSGVFAQVGNEIVEVIDISVAGIRIARPKQNLPHRNVEFRVIPRSSAGLHRSVPVCGHIVGHGDDHIRIAFSAVTTALVKLVDSFYSDSAADAPRASAGPPVSAARHALQPG